MFQIIAGFLGRGVLLGVLGSALAALLFVHVGYLILAFGIAIAGGTIHGDDPSLALLRYSVPLGLVAGCVIGYVWSRSVSSEFRRWCIAATGWIGLLIGAFPVSILLVLGSLYSIVIGIVPGILAGVIWASLIAGFTLAKYRSVNDAGQYQRSVRWLSVGLMLIISPVALIVGWGVIFNREAIVMLLGGLFTGSSEGFTNVFFLLVGLCGALVAWFLTPCLTGWYIDGSQSSYGMPPPGSTPDPTRNNAPSPDAPSTVSRYERHDGAVGAPRVCPRNPRVVKLGTRGVPLPHLGTSPRSR